MLSQNRKQLKRKTLFRRIYSRLVQMRDAVQ